jgi:hypothetical protein
MMKVMTVSLSPDPLYASFHGFWFIWESLGSDG